MSAGPVSTDQSRRSSLEARLARLGFSDAALTRDRLTDLGLVDDPAGGPVVEALAATADPDRALAALARLAAAEEHPADLLSAVRRHPGLRARLLAVLGASAALGNHLVRHRGSWLALADDADSGRRPSALGLRRLLLAAVGTGPDDSPATLDRLRVAYHHQILLLAARDLTGTLAVEDVAGELADLAAAALDAGLAVAAAGLPRGSTPVRLAVVGMGKCGARELNYASDVDVVFVAEPVEPAASTEEEVLRTATRLAEGLVRACGLVTAEGQLFPVDAGLRPEGRHGPLVRTLASHLAYYERWARTWEFQALLKARPVAGDLELGQRYRERLAPLVWEASARPGFVADVQAMRRRVEASVPRAQADRQLKLGPGGLRDVEFAVQLLQLVHGRVDDRLRAPDTLTALEALTGGGYVGREDGTRLAAAYRWLRATEHRLQLQQLRRTHTIPADPAGQRWLARSLGYPDVGAFERDRAGYAGEVRQLHEKLFYRPLLTSAARLPTADLRLATDAAHGRLTALGFVDTRAALAHLEALTTGVSRRAAIQRTLLPVLLEVFAGSADPDAGLLAFRQVSEALGETPWYLRLLRDTGVTAERLARVLSSSRYAADLLGRAPEAIAMLADDDELVPRSRDRLDAELAAVLDRAGDHWEATVATARALRRHELLRVACADVLGRLDVYAVGQALGAVTGAALQAALTVATRKVEAESRGPLPMRLAVLALGRLGGAEVGYGSDADVLFVHEPVGTPADRSPSDSAAAAAAHAVAEETRRLLALPAPDAPLLVDTGLRPEGRQGPLTRSLASYANYHRRWAGVWEAQALVRAAPCAGDADLAARFLAEVADPVRYPVGLPAEAVTEVRRLKARMETERIPAGVRERHLKLGPGRSSDVEWVAQLLTLRHAHEVPALRVTGTVPALRAGTAAGLLAPDDAEVLTRAWSHAAAARNALVLLTGRPSDLLPDRGPELAGVARLLGYPPGDTARFAEDSRRLARRARAVATRLLGGPPASDRREDPA
ncbi:MAG: bifunctional [glutamine synthetase] adenylyltransferase/[glutamine synthetase]-adenylyl-L-tyrosine phosphorylase [Mycobacteriales bacterium]